MLVLKNLDIDLTKSETRTLLGFGLIYFLLIFVIIISFSYLYYTFQKDLMLQEKRQILKNYSNELLLNLKYLHINFDKNKYYPRDNRFNSSIYDIDKNKIFSTLKNEEINLDETEYLKNKKIYFIKEPDSYYLGAKYVVINIDDDEKWLESVKKNVLLLSFSFLLFMSVFGHFLSQFFLKPMRDALHLLDRFIKDTTHELNTPISAIISNIEMIDKNNLDKSLSKKINRIEIGAKTISNIYEDLTYVVLENKIISENKTLNLSKILHQRIEYFKSLSNVKKIDIHTNIEDEVNIFCDSKKISKLIDNLLSNAIKYNKVRGKIKVQLKDNYLSIEDTGRGIEKENLDALFDRYSRFDKSVGGFGIGLNIVYKVVKEYNFKINIKSKINKGTKIELQW